VAVEPEAPQPVSDLASVLRSVLSGNLNPDLSSLPPELAALMQKALRQPLDA
jgi:hypothetical protein